MKFLHSVAVQDQLLGADGIFTFDLAVNPLSVVLVALRPLNDTGTLANFASYRAVCDAVNRLSIEHRGESIVNMSGGDAAAMAYFRHGIIPMQATHIDTNDFRRCVVLPILFGKHAYDKQSCFPASRRGELTMSLDVDIADTGYDGLRVSVETIEILDGKPTEFEKKITNTQTWAATGDQDMDLPPGNPCRGILVFGTTGFSGASPAPSWGRIATLLDNQQVGYSATDFEVAMTLPQLWGRMPPPMDAHKHRVTTDGNAQAELATLAGPYDVGSGGWQSYAFLDFDPTRDDTFTLQTKGASRFHLRANAETANAVRAIPVEVIKV